MDKEKSVDIRVQRLVDRVNDREYKGRKMVVEIDSHTDDMKSFVVTGNLTLSVSETPDVKESWITKDFSVMLTEDDPDMAIAEVFAHLNSIPMEYGDTIFEDDFDDVIKIVEGAATEAVAQADGPVQ
jgi:hypothetical protein